jgi:hypothetical protein
MVRMTERTQGVARRNPKEEVAMPGIVRKLIILSAGVLGACGGSGGSVVMDSPSGGYSSTEFTAIAGGRDMQVAIEGNPFPGVPDATFDRTVTTAMYGANFGPATNFTTTPGPSATPGYRVRMVFNGAPSMNTPSLCSAGPAQIDPTARPIVLKIAYCHLSGTMTSGTAYLGSPSGPTDPGFIRTIKNTTQSLFPPDTLFP